MTVALTPLSPRELDVLRLAAQGCPTKEIADRTDLTDSTVKNHLYVLRSKIGAASTVHAVAIMDDQFPGWRDAVGVGPSRGALAALLRLAADALEADRTP